MSAERQILAAIFDMDGLLIDSEPLWDRAELEVIASLGVDITRRNELPDTLGLRIDMVVDLWFCPAAMERAEPSRCHCAHYRTRHQSGGRNSPAAAGCA